MTIGIVTVFNSMNDGSFWQAMILKMELEKRGHNVCFFKVPKNPERPAFSKTIMGRIGKYLLRDGVICCYKYILSVIEFAECQKEFDKIDVSDSNKVDLVILGSDMIWCREGKTYFDKYHDFFWGEIFGNVPVVTYAGSCGSMKEWNEKEWITKTVNRWDIISVRDRNTFRIIKECTEKEVSLVCDPTLLVLPDYYKSLMKGYVGEKEKYILIYMFSNLTAEQGKEVTNYAKKHNLKIVSLIRRQRYMPKGSASVAVNSPYRLIEYYSKAELVITDTFHGSIFATLFKKKFIVLDQSKTQVNDVMDYLGYEDRIVDNSKLFMDKLLEPVDYVRKGKIEELRTNSLEYLEKVIEFGERSNK